MNTTFTPGPWTVRDTAAATLVYDEYGRCVCNATNHRGSTGTEDAANARLIASAPELLRVCRDIATEANFTDDDGVMDLGQRLIEIERIARAALAAAEGETHRAANPSGSTIEGDDTKNISRGRGTGDYTVQGL